jgi:hypothetical protein
MKDIIGQDITNGCIIAYARVSGSSADMDIAKVLSTREIVIPDYYASGYNNGGNRDKIDYRITVVTLRNVYNKTTNNFEEGISKKFTLYSPRNCVVLNPSLVPVKYTDMFAKVKV